MKKWICMLSLLSTQTFASPATELKAVIKCHQTIYSMYQNHKTEKFYNDEGKATPFVFPFNRVIYFITDQGLGVVKNNGKSFTVHVTNEKTEIYRKVSVSKSDGVTLEFNDSEADPKAETPKPALDDTNMKNLTNEIAREIKGVQAHYENENFPKDTVEALEKCKDISAEEVQKNLTKAIRHFENNPKYPKKPADEAKPGAK